MKKAATLLTLLVFVATGCCVVSDASVGNRDYLVGWYNLPNRHYRTRAVMPGPGTLIPVFKRDGVYYSLCRGGEIPLKVCPEGLEWGLTPSSMKGTKIGLDEASAEPYIIIEDAQAQYEGDYSTSGEKQFMTKTAKPADLLDPTVTPPRTNDDILGCYQPVWFPFFRCIVSKNGEKYHLEGQIARKDGWESQANESAALEPLPGKLGFSWGSKKDVLLIFNHDLNRFECVSSDGAFRMPLVRVLPSLPPGTGAVSPPVKIGIPSWH